MSQDFSYFVILAGMRTGSNFLESSLNEYAGIESLGELFNPHFIGSPKKFEFMGLSLKDREADPLTLVDLVKQRPSGLAGFRLFGDHDHRVLDACLKNRDCAKIILTRNPVDSYVSREIARETNQWRLSDLKHAKTAKIRFDRNAFEKHLSDAQGFQLKLQRTLQTSGQTAFYIGYDDIQDAEIIKGLVRFLGLNGDKIKSSTPTKKQNPGHLTEKVENFSDMETALKSVDYFQINGTPNFEPRRGPAIPGYIAAVSSPLLFMPIASGPTGAITNWLADLDGANPEHLTTSFNQKTLRQWKRQSKGHRSFSVVRHPVARLHDAFVRHILLQGPETFSAIRETLCTTYKLEIPRGIADAGYDARAHRRAFISFAKIIRGNLNGQTGFRVADAWASQSECIRGMSQFMYPDHIFRECGLASELEYLAKSVDKRSPVLTTEKCISPVQLQDIYDQDVEAAVRAVYQRDYMMFGFRAWNV